MNFFRLGFPSYTILVSRESWFFSPSHARSGILRSIGSTIKARVVGTGIASQGEPPDAPPWNRVFLRAISGRSLRGNPIERNVERCVKYARVGTCFLCQFNASLRVCIKWVALRTTARNFWLIFHVSWKTRSTIAKSSSKFSSSLPLSVSV